MGHRPSSINLRGYHEVNCDHVRDTLPFILFTVLVPRVVYLAGDNTY